MQGVGFRVSGLGFRVWGFGIEGTRQGWFRVESLGVRGPENDADADQLLPGEAPLQRDLSRSVQFSI